MTPKQAILITILSVLIFMALPSTNKVAVQPKRPLVFSRRPKLPPAAPEKLSPCSNLQISRVSALCESPYGFIACLDFPQVDVDTVLAGEQFFPANEATFYADDQVIDGVQYRNITFVL